MDKTHDSDSRSLEALQDVLTADVATETPDLRREPLFDQFSVTDNTPLGKPKRPGNTAGMKIDKRYPKKRYAATDKWLEGEPDYKEGKEYKEALEAVRTRVTNVLIVSYAGLGRMLNDMNPKYPTFLDSILDDLKDVVRYEKHKPAPSMVMSVTADKESIDYEEVFRRAA